MHGKSALAFSMGALLLSAATATTAAEMDKPVFSLPSEYETPETKPYARNSPAGAKAFSGFVEGQFGHSRGSAGGFDADGTTWALRGTGNVGSPGGWNFQADGMYGRTSVEGFEVDALVGAAHAYYRQPENAALGAFVQGGRYGSDLFDMLTGFGGDDHATDIVGGGEAAFFAEMATLYAQAGYGRLSYTGLDADHWLGRLGARLYATDNIRFDFEGGLDRFSAYGIDVDVYSVSAIGNYRFDQAPVTAFAGYRYDRGTTNVTSGGVDVHTFLAGLRAHFGSTTLRDEERNGPMWSSSGIMF